MHSSSLIPVEGNSNLKRDPKTGAIVNTDRSEYEKYIAQREAKQSDKERLNKLESEISEIKQLLVKLTTGINTKLLSKASKVVSNATGFPVQYNKALSLIHI